MHIDMQVRQNVTVPPDLRSPQAKLIYFSLAVSQDATLDDLCRDLDIEKSTALSILGTLRNRGHVERRDDGYVVV